MTVRNEQWSSQPMVLPDFDTGRVGQAKYFTDCDWLTEDNWKEGDRDSWQYAYWQIRAQLPPDQVFRKDAPRATVAVNRNMMRFTGAEVSCGQCGARFTPKNGRHRFCSVECLAESRRIPLEDQVLRKPRECPMCGDEFVSLIPHKVYCREACAQEARKRRKRGI